MLATHSQTFKEVGKKLSAHSAIKCVWGLTMFSEEVLCRTVDKRAPAEAVQECLKQLPIDCQERAKPSVLVFSARNIHSTIFCFTFCEARNSQRNVTLGNLGLACCRRPHLRLKTCNYGPPKRWRQLPLNHTRRDHKKQKTGR